MINKISEVTSIVNGINSGLDATEEKAMNLKPYQYQLLKMKYSGKNDGEKTPQTEAQQAMAQVQELVAAGTSGSGVNIKTKNQILDLIEGQFAKALGSTPKRKTTQLKPLHGSQPCRGAGACITE